MNISISPGNIKLGTIPSISLPPERTCIGKPCGNLCYARRMEMYRPAVRSAWERNWKAYEEGTYMSQVYEWLNNKKPSYFRWHVGGDIVNQEYLNDMVVIASLFQNTKFLSFTKNYTLRFEAALATDNLSVVVSMWPNIPAPKGAIINSLPKAWMFDKNNIDNRIPTNAIHCGGDCSTCASCWNLKNIHKDVVFHKH